jgi:NADPH:quinone reductase
MPSPKIAIFRRRSSLDVANRMGSEASVAIYDHPTVISEVRNVTRDGLCNRLIDVTGKQWPLDLAVSWFARGAD